MMAVTLAPCRLMKTRIKSEQFGKLIIYNNLGSSGDLSLLASDCALVVLMLLLLLVAML